MKEKIKNNQDEMKDHQEELRNEKFTRKQYKVKKDN